MPKRLSEIPTAFCSWNDYWWWYILFSLKKTNNKVKSWAIGTGAATILGLAKELIDPEIDAADLGYTALGGAIGASIVFPLKKKKPKEVAYLF